MSCQKEPCKECPFLKTSAPGWLGGYGPITTHHTAVSDGPFLCHPTRTTDNPKECAGRLLYAAKCAKQFDDGRLNRLKQELKEAHGTGLILSFPEFLEHHKDACDKDGKGI